VKKVFVVLILLSGMLAVAPALAQKSAALQRLIDGARKEGQLDLMISSSVGGEHGGKELTEVFKRRFGLEQLKTNADLAGQESQKFNQAVTESKAGIPPTYDLMQGTDENVLSLKEAGGVEPIANWESLLAEVAPEAAKVKDKVSPHNLAGYGFLWSTRTAAILYNPKAIAEADLPKTWKQMGDPKYKAAFSVPPFTSLTLMGLLKYEKEELLDVIRAWGRNKRDVLVYDAAAQRVMLGDLKFSYGNTDIYIEQKANDPNAPIEAAFFEDLTPRRNVMYLVRKGARHPSAAKLFALWVTGAEANGVIEKYNSIENLGLARGPVSSKILKILEKKNIKSASWFDSAKNAEKFLWLGTDEGRKYSQAIARAQREGK
jgi:ABC-type Fe3+ transport system substrate-binding protein